MDATDRSATRRDSVSHAQPVVHDSTHHLNSRQDVAKTDNLEDSVEVATQAAIASAAQPAEQAKTPAGPQAYAFEERKHVSSLARKLCRNKSHRPRQASRSETAQTVPVSTYSKTTATDSDIDQQLLALLKLEAGADEAEMAVSYSKASPSPPVTADSLSELDIARIINNPKLRHDVNFDKELHFRPNLDGSRGKQKLKAADDFWNALVAELVLYRAVGAKLMASTSEQDAAYWTRMMTSSQKRLPVMFETIRDILKTLVPERDQSTVAERLDVAMIMQEISRGLFDMMSLAEWLSALLKAHCAPMRDDWIDQMVAQVQKGVDTNNQRYLVNGLRQLLAILEAMKLDVANHQIRHLRALLIEDGVAFQQKFHMSRIHYGRLDTSRSRKWYLREYSRHITASAQPDKIRVFTSLLLKSVLSQHLSLPESFYLDMDRLRLIRADVHNFIYTNVCAEILNSTIGPQVSDEVRTKAQNDLADTLQSLVGDSRKYADCAGNIAVEIVRSALECERSTERVDSARTEIVEKKLQLELTPTGFKFGRLARQVYNACLPTLEKQIRDNLPLTPVTLHDRMFAPVVTHTTAKGVFTEHPKSIEAILGRICHVAVLHWHIWSPLAYEVVVEQNDTAAPVTGVSGAATMTTSDTESEAGSDVSDASASTNSSTTTSSPRL